jgi:two-component system chemotaxis response regulator CheY
MSTKVLIADKSKEDREIIKETLLSSEFDVFHITKENIYEANDGLEAFGIMGKHPDIEFFFSEIDMPHLNGYELLEVLHDTDKIQKAKIVFISNSTITKSLSTSMQKSILGTISKPIDSAGIIESFKKLVEDALEKESKDAEEKARVRLVQDEQRSVIKSIIEKYYTLSKFETTIDLDKLSSIIEVYIHEDDFIPSEDLMVIIPPIVSEFLMEMEISAKVDNYKLQFLFDNQLIEVREEKEKAKEKVFEANLMNDPDIEEQNFSSIVLEDMIKEIEMLNEIDVDVDTKEVVEKRFDHIVQYIKEERIALDGSKKSLDYIRMRCFMFKAYELLTDVDFTIDVKELRDIKKRIEAYLKDIEYYSNFKNKNSPEYCFDEIFALYQKKYLKYKYVANEMFQNREQHKQYRTLIEKLDKKVAIFKKTETKTFYGMFMKQLQKIIVAYYDLLNKYTYQFDQILWDRARESNAVKNFFQSRKIIGPLCTKSLLSYYVKVNKVNEEDANRYSALASLLEKSNPKNVIYVSNNVKESSILENAITSIDTNWKFYTLAKFSLVDSWITGNDMPDLMIIDFKFDTEVENGYDLLKMMYKKYPKLHQIKHRIIMVFDKISIDTIEEAGKYGVKEFLKRPLVASEVKNKLRFL